MNDELSALQTNVPELSLQQRSIASDDNGDSLCERCSLLFSPHLNSIVHLQSGKSLKCVKILGSTCQSCCRLCKFFRSIFFDWGTESGFTLYLVGCLRYYAMENMHAQRFAWPDVGDTNFWVCLPADSPVAEDTTTLDNALKCAIRERGAIASADTDTRACQYKIRTLQPHVIDFNILRNWLDFCTKYHTTTCDLKQVQRVQLLTVIDCDRWSLCMIRAGSQYLALSYVWGSSATTHQPDLSSEKFELPRDVPLVIKDAIKVTTALGFRYLWVDRYCISNNARIKHSQINTMDLVYRNAYATIIAAAGDDPSFGLPGVSSRLRNPQPCITIDNIMLASTMPHPGVAIGKSRWSSRAWTYQECLLSRRRLFFTIDQVYFECHSMHCCESVDLPLDRIHTPNRTRLLHPMQKGLYPLNGLGRAPSEVWSRIEDYTRRSLTYDSDALNGMAGMLRAYRESNHRVYQFWGVPFWSERILRFGIPARSEYLRTLDSFLKSLCWRLLRPSLRRPEFPSWSWTGWKGPVCTQYKDNLSAAEFIAAGGLKLAVELRDTIDCKWNWVYDIMKSADPRLDSAWKDPVKVLRLTAKTVRVSIVNHPAVGWTLRKSRHSKPISDSFRLYSIQNQRPLYLCKDPASDEDFRERLDHEDFTAIVLGRKWQRHSTRPLRAEDCLVLILDNDAEGSLCERIGYSTIGGWELRQLPLKTRTVRIK